MAREAFRRAPVAPLGPALARPAVVRGTGQPLEAAVVEAVPTSPLASPLVLKAAGRVAAASSPVCPQRLLASAVQRASVAGVLKRLQGFLAVVCLGPPRPVRPVREPSRVSAPARQERKGIPAAPASLLGLVQLGLIRAPARPLQRPVLAAAAEPVPTALGAAAVQWPTTLGWRSVAARQGRPKLLLPAVKRPERRSAALWLQLPPDEAFPASASGA